MRRGAAGNAHSQRDFGGVVIHQHHVCGLDGSVRTQRTHGDAHVCAGKHRRVVDAVTHKGKVLLGLLFSQQLFDLVHLVTGQKTGVVLVQTQLLRYSLCHRLCIAGQHDRLAHTGSLQSADGIGAVGLYHVRNQQIARIAALHGNVHMVPTPSTAGTVSPSFFIRRALPAATALPSTFAVTP